jgi:hypothetical protein
MKDMIAIILWLLVSFLLALTCAWGAQSTAWWSGPVSMFGAVLSAATGCYAMLLLVICATARGNHNG